MRERWVWVMGLAILGEGGGEGDGGLGQGSWADHSGQTWGVRWERTIPAMLQIWTAVSQSVLTGWGVWEGGGHGGPQHAWLGMYVHYV